VAIKCNVLSLMEGMREISRRLSLRKWGKVGWRSMCGRRGVKSFSMRASREEWEWDSRPRSKDRYG